MSAPVRKQEAFGALTYAPRWARLQPLAGGLDAGAEDETPPAAAAQVSLTQPSGTPESGTRHPGTQHWDAPDSGTPHPGALHWDTPDPGTQTAPWKRKRAPASFEGDVAIMELRARLALAPEGIPVPPLRQSRGGVLGMVGRLACMFVLGGALGLVWLSISQGGLPERPFVLNPDEQVASPVATAGLKIDFERAPQSLAKPLDLLPWPAPRNGDPGRDETTGASAMTAALASAGPAYPALPRATQTRALESRPAVENRPSEPKMTPALPASEAASPAGPMPDRDEIAALIARGRSYFAAGDVAAARLLLRRAAVEGDSRAALALGGTYDPIVLKELGAIGFAGDPAQARDWYRRAAELGSADAPQRLEQLARLDR